MPRNCQQEGCTVTRAGYGVEGGPATHCAKHGKPLGLVDVIHQRCKEVGCKKRPNFGILENKAEYCSEHALAGMFDVTHRLCKHSACDKQPSFGFDKGKAEYCSEHALDDMICLRKRCCKHFRM